jgi:hypothetical protein
MANLGANFYPKLVQMASELGMKPEDIIAVMTSESGMNPAAHNPGGASGLIQFMPDTLRSIKFPGTPADFRRLSGEEQLPWIKKLISGNIGFNGGKPFTTGGQYYTANMWPVALKLPGVQGGDESTVILEKSPQSEGGFSKRYADIGIKIPASQEAMAYKENFPLFDKEHKGYITLGDMNRQINQNRKSHIYQGSIATMHGDTGYKPGIRQEQKPQQQPSMIADIGGQYNLDALLGRFLSMFSTASEKQSLKSLYRSSLPSHNILISIASPDYNSAVEFSRVLCSALDEELLSRSFSHTDGHNVEIECSINGPAKECFGAVKQLSDAVADVFKQATKKIGGIGISTTCQINKQSNFQPISLKTAETHYRQFALKFAQGQNAI